MGLLIVGLLLHWTVETSDYCMAPGCHSSQRYLREGHLAPSDDRVQTSEGGRTLAVAPDAVNPADKSALAGIKSKQFKWRYSIRCVPAKQTF